MKDIQAERDSSEIFNIDMLIGLSVYEAASLLEQLDINLHLVDRTGNYPKSRIMDGRRLIIAHAEQSESSTVTVDTLPCNTQAVNPGFMKGMHVKDAITYLAGYVTNRYKVTIMPYNYQFEVRKGKYRDQLAYNDSIIESCEVTGSTFDSVISVVFVLKAFGKVSYADIADACREEFAEIDAGRSCREVDALVGLSVFEAYYVLNTINTSFCLWEGPQLSPKTMSDDGEFMIITRAEKIGNDFFVQMRPNNYVRVYEEELLGKTVQKAVEYLASHVCNYYSIMVNSANRIEIRHGQDHRWYAWKNDIITHCSVYRGQTNQPYVIRILTKAISDLETQPAKVAEPKTEVIKLSREKEIQILSFLISKICKSSKYNHGTSEYTALLAARYLKEIKKVCAIDELDNLLQIVGELIVEPNADIDNVASVVIEARDLVTAAINMSEEV